MERPISDIAFTPAVKAAQEARGSRRSYSKMEQRGGWADVVTPELRDFIAQRDSLYLGTANASGQPYIQHREGPKGFLKILDDRTLALADFAGNAQYISLGITLGISTAEESKCVSSSSFQNATWSCILAFRGDRLDC